MTEHPRYRTQRATSAGGVVYRDGPDGVEVVLLETRGGVSRFWAWHFRKELGNNI